MIIVISDQVADALLNVFYSSQAGTESGKAWEACDLVTKVHVTSSSEFVADS